MLWVRWEGSAWGLQEGSREEVRCGSLLKGPEVFSGQEAEKAILSKANCEGREA